MTTAGILRLAAGGLLALAITAPPQQAAAQTEHRFEAGAFGGGAFFSSDHGLGRYQGDPEGLSPAASLAFGGRLAVNLLPRLTLESELLFAPTHSRDDAADMFIVGYRANLLLSLARGRIEPFLLAGAGGLSAAVHADPGSPLESDHDATVHLGAGAKIFFTDSLGLRLDGRVLAPPAILGSLVRFGDESDFGGPDFELLAALVVRFGRIVAPAAPAPPPPPPADPDPDRDQVLGEADRCPEVPEDRDGFEDEDGCPEPDNDQDAIADAQDRCPLQPENRNGVEDEDGCPEEDTDGDGFFGAADKCPDAPETKNNYLEHDGCPDEVPPAVKKFTGVIQGINFQFRSAKILKKSLTILDQAVRVLQEYPDIHLEIGGHTDDRGTAEFNQELSHRRAEAVKTYLVSKGIAPERLRTAGYGLTQPRESNKTAAGRARNRRIEFTLVATDAAR